jgi:hypothetical protein
MEWKFHVLGAFLVYIFMGLILPMTIPMAMGSLLTLSFFSMAPDVDHPKSVMRKVAFILLMYFLVVFVILQAATGSFEKVVMISAASFASYYFYKNLPLTHRGKRSLHRWRYTIITTLGFSLALAASGVTVVLGIFAAIGYALHLALDKIKEF